MKKTIYSQFTVITILLLSALIGVSCKTATGSSSENLMDSIDYKKSTPDWAAKSNIYEVNIRQYTPDGTFKAFQKNLPRLKSMGVDILWLMPINPIGVEKRKGSLGSYYSVKDYTAINPEFGTEKDFKELVSEAHKMGMHLIVDWVANHTAWDNVWIKPHSDWYTKDSLGKITIPKGTDWEDTADLNYNNPELRRAMIDAMVYWVKNADIDGFRCDVAGMIPLSFWLHARKEIDKAKPGCFFLAEDGEPVIHKAFDATYNWPMKDCMDSIAKGKKDVNDLVAVFESEAKRFDKQDIRMQFTTNHDLNTWNGSEYERLGDDAVDAFTVLTYTVPGIPLTYTGQEEPIKKRLRFFDKDTVGFNKYLRQDFITKLNTLRKENKILWNTGYNDSFRILKNTCPKDVLSFIRFGKDEKIVCIFNFSSNEQTFKITDELKDTFTNLIGEPVSLKTNTTITLKPWTYSVQKTIK
jgi:cyclomaltodextrinase / maltogenic alpha-amylase / neopullulanase